jgi:hypothetical protein
MGPWKQVLERESPCCVGHSFNAARLFITRARKRDHVRGRLADVVCSSKPTEQSSTNFMNYPVMSRNNNFLFHVTQCID